MARDNNKSKGGQLLYKRTASIVKNQQKQQNPAAATGEYAVSEESSSSSRKKSLVQMLTEAVGSAPHSEEFYGFGCSACHEDPEERDERLHKNADEFVESLKASVENISENISAVLPVPHWVHDKYIEHGYRAETTFKALVYSLFWMHNETINVWSHLFGFFFFIYLCIDTMTRISEDGASFADKSAFIIFFVCSCICFLMSSVYHWFNIHSHSLYKALIALDMAGIFFMIFGSVHSGVHFSMNCESLYEIRTAYQVAFGAVCLSGVVLTFFPKFDTPTIKISVFLTTASLGVIPMVHIISVFGLYYSMDWWILGSLYGFGMIFYAFRFPEKNFPGKFQIYFSSHQLWHIMVFLAAYYHHTALVAMYESSKTEVCHLVDTLTHVESSCENLIL